VNVILTANVNVNIGKQQFLGSQACQLLVCFHGVFLLRFFHVFDPLEFDPDTRVGC
jgi:hypothetical protein